MSDLKTTVVICQAQGRNPVKRQLEDDIFSTLMNDPNIYVSLLPHLYDMSHAHSGMQFLKAVPGRVVILGWLYERAIRWTLDRAGIRGHEGETLIKSELEVPDDHEETHEPRGIGITEVPDRMIYCIDLRVSDDSEEYCEEVRRIAAEPRRVTDITTTGVDGQAESFDLMSFINGQPNADQLERYLNPERQLEARRAFDSGDISVDKKEALPEDTRRRWYPVIDYTRCTNCMECIDFCLFGVYGVDALDRILVEEQDNCKKGCPACSRVCPENAIIFPHHKTPAIAGADGEVGGIKIDLSKLFGGDDGLSAIDMAVKERDRELILDGREAVGTSVGLRERERDEYDDLMDELDALEF